MLHQTRGVVIDRSLGNMKEHNRAKVVIRKYETTDHDQVCKLFYNGIVENWVPAYRRTINTRAPLPAVIQLCVASVLFQNSSSFMSFLLAEFFIQAFIMFIYFYFYWAYAW